VFLHMIDQSHVIAASKMTEISESYLQYVTVPSANGASSRRTRFLRELL
jgi:hypothetical protein